MSEDKIPSIICRGKNLHMAVMKLFLYALPKKEMPKSEFLDLGEMRMNGFKTTHSQIARQMGLYYCDTEGICHPRYTYIPSNEELFKYCEHWAEHYFIPNPYTPSFPDHCKPTIIYAYLYNHRNENLSINEALHNIFDLNLNETDKAKAYLTQFTDMFELPENKYSFLSKNKYDIPENVDIDKNDVKAFFYYFGNHEKEKKLSQTKGQTQKTNQVIFYGAPGTGKSHTIKELTKGKNVIRTTFHPDSDYSTFVGAYKPTTTKVKVRDSAGHVVVDEGKEVTEERIVYKFIEQAFLESYINAWKLYAKSEQSTKPEEQYLVIEEINRGNCAQIFGDLFQLLDRKANGFSDYPIKTDSDIQKHLANAFSGLTILNSTELDEIYKDDVKNASAKIKNGDVLILPPNLYIWATMNTSDQSLFPIDSAFKRRWDWMYSPIKYNHEMTIDINGTKYSWTEFQKEVNKRIFADTNSEDKLLGDYFVNPSDGIITEEVLVNKVLFYLWNDVCKDGDGDIFKKADGDVLTFSELYNNDDSISTDNLLLLMKHLELEPEAEESAENQETESVEDIDRDEEGNDAPLAESIE